MISYTAVYFYTLVIIIIGGGYKVKSFPKRDQGCCIDDKRKRIAAERRLGKHVDHIETKLLSCHLFALFPFRGWKARLHVGVRLSAISTEKALQRTVH